MKQNEPINNIFMNKNLYDTIWEVSSKYRIRQFMRDTICHWMDFSTLQENEFTYIEYLNIDERDASEKIKNNHYRYTYKLNEWGYRSSDPTIKTTNFELATFGCSITYGIGLPEEETLPYLLSKKLNTNYLNLGIPSGSISKITRLFKNYVNLYKPKTCFILFPPINREEIIFKNDNSDKYYFTDFVPGFYSEYDIVKNFIMGNPLEYLEIGNIKSMELIKYIAMVNNITLYVSSWDVDTYEIVKKIFSNDIVLTRYTFDSTIYGFARDGMHPHGMHNVNFINENFGNTYITK
jgi:hypothetical protein